MEHSHEAHVHGEAELLIAVDVHVMEIQFHSPAINLIGFEYSPQTPHEKQQLAKVRKQLQQPDQLFRLPPEAGCTLQHDDIEIPFQAAAEEHEMHADFSGLYRYHCKTPAKINQIDIDLFEQFPLIEKIQVQLISDQGQRAFEQHPGQTIIEM